jgi:cell division protein FtsB
MSQVKTVKIKNGEGFCIINAADFKKGVHELCDGESRGEEHKVTVTLSAETSPELQQAIYGAKAECEKVRAENDDLKQQIETLKAGIAQGEPADLSGLVPTEQFDAVAQKLTETEEQLNKEREAGKKLTAEKEALLAQVKDLESKLKKHAAEAKVAKAAESKAEQPKE